ncbi:MAG: response regulator [Myxococcales bacterium]|nr:response regulator [Myxococcales bacterium]
MKVGCDGYITKPIDPILLPGQVGQYLGDLPPRPPVSGSRPTAVAEARLPRVDDQLPILVIEDNPTTRKMFRISLESAGYRVVEAHDARTALALVEHCRPALIIQDLHLPDMDGLTWPAARAGDAVADVRRVPAHRRSGAKALSQSAHRPAPPDRAAPPHHVSLGGRAVRPGAASARGR